MEDLYRGNLSCSTSTLRRRITNAPRWSRHRVTASTPPGAKLPSNLLDAADDTTRGIVGWWHRMHAGQRPQLVASVTKLVVWTPTAGAPPLRCIWEICRWRLGDSFQWHFVCWEIDGTVGPGAWWRKFPSKRAALAYYQQAPEHVMRKPDDLIPTDPAKQAA